jgi:hypothetical protein
LSEAGRGQFETITVGAYATHPQEPQKPPHDYGSQHPNIWRQGILLIFENQHHKSEKPHGCNAHPGIPFSQVGPANFCWHPFPNPCDPSHNLKSGACTGEKKENQEENEGVHYIQQEFLKQ